MNTITLHARHSTHRLASALGERVVAGELSLGSSIDCQLVARALQLHVLELAISEIGGMLTEPAKLTWESISDSYESPRVRARLQTNSKHSITANFEPPPAEHEFYGQLAGTSVDERAERGRHLYAALARTAEAITLIAESQAEPSFIWDALAKSGRLDIDLVIAPLHPVEESHEPGPGM